MIFKLITVLQNLVNLFIVVVFFFFLKLFIMIFQSFYLTLATISIISENICSFYCDVRCSILFVKSQYIFLFLSMSTFDRFCVPLLHTWLHIAIPLFNISNIFLTKVYRKIFFNYTIKIKKKIDFALLNFSSLFFQWLSLLYSILKLISVYYMSRLIKLILL